MKKFIGNAHTKLFKNCLFMYIYKNQAWLYRSWNRTSKEIKGNEEKSANTPAEPHQFTAPMTRTAKGHYNTGRCLCTKTLSREISGITADDRSEEKRDFGGDSTH